MVVEALKELSRSRRVVEVFELPIGPPREVLIADLTDHGDFIKSILVLSTTTELADEEWQPVAFGILCAGTNAILVPETTLCVVSAKVL